MQLQTRLLTTAVLSIGEASVQLSPLARVPVKDVAAELGLSVGLQEYDPAFNLGICDVPVFGSAVASAVHCYHL